MKNGWRGWNRTTNLRFWRPLRCQLRHTPMKNQTENGLGKRTRTSRLMLPEHALHQMGYTEKNWRPVRDSNSHPPDFVGRCSVQLSQRGKIHFGCTLARVAGMKPHQVLSLRRRRSFLPPTGTSHASFPRLRHVVLQRHTRNEVRLTPVQWLLRPHGNLLKNSARWVRWQRDHCNDKKRPGTLWIPGLWDSEIQGRCVRHFPPVFGNLQASSTGWLWANGRGSLDCHEWWTA